MNTRTLNDLPLLLGRGGTWAESLGDALATGFHKFLLFAIGATIVWLAGATFFDLLERGHVTVEDVLLLFIFLELGATVGVYFKTNSLPVRYLIYVAITALTRLLIMEPSPETDIVVVSASILILALGILVLRIGSFKYPSARNVSLAEADGAD